MATFAGLSAKANCLCQNAALFSIIWRDHRIVCGQAPLGAVVIKCQIMSRHQMPFCTAIWFAAAIQTGCPSQAHARNSGSAVTCHRAMRWHGILKDTLATRTLCAKHKPGKPGETPFYTQIEPKVDTIEFYVPLRMQRDELASLLRGTESPHTLDKAICRERSHGRPKGLLVTITIKNTVAETCRIDIETTIFKQVVWLPISTDCLYCRAD